MIAYEPTVHSPVWAFTLQATIFLCHLFQCYIVYTIER